MDLSQASGNQAGFLFPGYHWMPLMHGLTRAEKLLRECNSKFGIQESGGAFALATSADQTVTLIAYIEYSDGTKVQLSTPVKIQNRICCPGYLITNGAFEGGPSAVNTGLNVSSTLALFPASTKNLCVGPDFEASRTWDSVTGTFCNTNVHNQGGDWNDGDNTWRLPNIAELANMQAIKGSIPNLTTSIRRIASPAYIRGVSGLLIDLKNFNLP